MFFKHVSPLIIVCNLVIKNEHLLDANFFLYNNRNHVEIAISIGVRRRFFSLPDRLELNVWWPWLVFWMHRIWILYLLDNGFVRYPFFNVNNYGKLIFAEFTLISARKKKSKNQRKLKAHKIRCIFIQNEMKRWMFVINPFQNNFVEFFIFFFILCTMMRSTKISPS